tara:strand:+ start:229 stop:1305 length:1077 start_codon:yes stop_codon:yes gene_type:complete
MILPKIKPSSPCFSSGPTKKPDEWSLQKINHQYFGRYHRSDDVKLYVLKILQKIRKTLKIPKTHKIFLLPGSCTGAMNSVIWSLLDEKRSITSIIYDYWAQIWFDELKKLNLKVDCRKSLDGSIPNLEKIPKENDLIFVWTGTSTGMTVSNLDFISNDHRGLVISDITSAAFIYEIPWDKLDVAVFSWQKALGSESQHGIAIISPKAGNRISKKNNVPKILDLNEYDYLINTPSLLSIADFELCLDIYNSKGGVSGNAKICKENKSILDIWEKKSDFINHFSKLACYQALTPSYFVFKKEFKYKKLFKFLSDQKIAYDIQNYRKARPGIRVWTGPTIKKKDLITLTNWLDWSFNKFIK